MKSAFNRSILALAAIVVVAGASQANAQQKSLHSYQSGTKEFWTHPPDDWFLGDETEAQKGLAPPSGPPTGSSEAELSSTIKKIKLPPGFKIEVYAPGVLAARQMAWGDKGTLFVGSFGLGNVYSGALGVRTSVGGDVDPRSGKYWFTENARDWVSDDLPSDKLNMISKIGEHFGYPYCHQGDLPDPKFAMGHKCSEFTPPVLNLGAHVAPLGMKFYTGDQFPAEYKNNILIAEHGSWNRHKYQGARIMRVMVGPDGKNAKQEVFASGWLEGDQGYLGRPADIILAKDGSILVADDWAGAIYRISYNKK